MTGLRQRFFLATHATPLRRIWRGTYQLAIDFVVGRLARTEGVRSVYLRSGLLDEPIYGLSDIDLVVLIDDVDGYTRLRVSELLCYLKTLVPMLEPIDGVGIYPADRIATVLAGSPRLQYLLLGMPRRLLHGPDLLAGLRVTATPAAQARDVLAEAWSLAIEVMAGPAGPERAWQWSKILTRVVRAIELARTGELVAARRDVLAGIAGGIDAELLAIARAPLERARPVGLAEAWAAIHDLVSAALPYLAPPRPSAELLPLPVAGSSPSPNLFVTDDPLELPCASPREVARLSGRPSQAAVDALLARAGGREHVFVERDDIIYPLSRPRLYGLCLRSTHPELFAPQQVPAWRWQEIVAIWQRRRAAALALAPSWLKLDDASYVRLFASTLEATAEPRRLLATPAACGEGLEGADRDTAAALTGWLARGDRHPLPTATFRASLRLLQRRLGVTDDEAQPRLPARASISVVICTRNRSGYLDRLLGILAAQTRLPDEVVVVDNGSNDDTPAVIDRWRARLDIADVYLATPGIPGARNAGMRRARGDILVYADDDTAPVPGWLASIEAAFGRDPCIGMVGGDVVQARQQTGKIADFMRIYMGGA